MFIENDIWPIHVLRNEAIKEAVEYIKNIKGKKPVVTDAGWWKQAADAIETKGLHLEFGVFEGESLNQVLNRILKDDPKKLSSHFDPIFHKLIDLLLQKSASLRASI